MECHLKILVGEIFVEEALVDVEGMRVLLVERERVVALWGGVLAESAEFVARRWVIRVAVVEPGRVVAVSPSLVLVEEVVIVLAVVGRVERLLGEVVVVVVAGFVLAEVKGLLHVVVVFARVFVAFRSSGVQGQERMQHVKI